MNNIKLALSILALVGSVPLSATSISAVGVLSTPSNMGSRALAGEPYSGKNYGVGGLIATGDILEFEIGALYVGRRIASTDANFNVLEVPAVFRLSPFSFLSIAAGGYFSRALGAVRIGQGQGGPVHSFEDMNYARNEAGVMGSLSISVPLIPTLSLLSDVRYLYGLTHLLDTSMDNSFFRGFQLLAGLRLSL